MFFVCILVQAHILQIYTFYIYRGMLAANPLPFSYGMWKPIPLMSVFKTDTVPMR